MSKRLILHAGMHKTGTSSIQAFLHAADLGNATYFRWQKPNHSILFVLLFAEQPEAHWYFRQRGASVEQLAERRVRLRRMIRQQIRTSDHDLFLFSAERIYGAERRDLANCRSFFAKFFEDIHVHCYVREPMDFAASMFQQGLKTGGLPGPKGILPAFRKHIGNLDDVFGRDGVDIRQFADPQQKTADIVADFREWVGLTGQSQAEITINKSLSADAVSLLYLFRKRSGFVIQSPEAVHANQSLIKGLSGIAGPRMKLLPEFFSDVAGSLDEDRRWMEQRMGHPFRLRSAVTTSETAVFSSLQGIEDHGRAVFRRLSGVDFDVGAWAGADTATRFAEAVCHP